MSLEIDINRHRPGGRAAGRFFLTKIQTVSLPQKQSGARSSGGPIDSKGWQGIAAPP